MHTQSFMWMLGIKIQVLMLLRQAPVLCQLSHLPRPNWFMRSKICIRLHVVAHTFNPSTWKAEAVGSVCSRPAYSTAEGIPVQSGLQRTPTLKNKNKQKKSKYYLYLCVNTCAWLPVEVRKGCQILQNCN